MKTFVMIPTYNEKDKKPKALKTIENIMINMKQEMVQIPKREYEELLEEVGILRNEEMMASISESDEAKTKGVKTWELKTHR